MDTLQQTIEKLCQGLSSQILAMNWVRSEPEPGTFAQEGWGPKPNRALTQAETREIPAGSLS